MRGNPDMTLAYVMVLIFGCIAAIFDMKTRRIPNKLVLAMLITWLLIIKPKLVFDTDAALVYLESSALGLLVSGGMFVLVYFLSRKGLGGGDVKFMAVVGLYMGFGGVISVILIGSILAAITGGTLILFKKIRRKDPIPLAPFLLIGIALTVLLQ
ncbi:MAG: prepilin peptidase [Oscillospiraceae bacterium]|nr:prepilin peptidase [Oscillospiraceae bacterium]